MPTARSDDWRGAGFMLLAMAGYGLNDLMVKLVAAHLPAAMILAIRSAMAVLLLLGLLALRREIWQIRASLTGRALLRALLDTGATIGYVHALTGLSLANAAAIYQMTPIVFMLASAALLREAIPRSGWIGTALGFAGVLLVIRPDGAMLDPHALAVVVAVLCSVARDLLMRDSLMPSPICLALLSAACTSLFGLGALTTGGTAAPEPTQVGLLALAATAIAVGYVFLALATATGGSGFVSPFRYSILVYATFLGMVVLGQYPDAPALLGIGLILLGGVTVALPSSRPRP